MWGVGVDEAGEDGVVGEIDPARPVGHVHVVPDRVDTSAVDGGTDGFYALS